MFSIFGYDYRFWIAVFGAVILKLATSESHSVKKVFITWFTAAFVAWVATEPLIGYLELDAERYTVLTAAVLALTGDSIVKWLMSIKPESLIKMWRGRS